MDVLVDAKGKSSAEQKNILTKESSSKWTEIGWFIHQIHPASNSNLCYFSMVTMSMFNIMYIWKLLKWGIPKYPQASPWGFQYWVMEVSIVMGVPPFLIHWFDTIKVVAPGRQFKFLGKQLEICWNSLQRPNYTIYIYIYYMSTSKL